MVFAQSPQYDDGLLFSDVTVWVHIVPVKHSSEVLGLHAFKDPVEERVLGEEVAVFARPHCQVAWESPVAPVAKA